MEIKNTTVMTEDFYISFQRMGKYASKLVMFFYILPFAVMLCANVWMIYLALRLIILYGSTVTVPYMLVVIVVTVLWLLFKKSKYKRMFKNFHLRNATITFTFSDDKLISQTVSETVDSNSEAFYKNFAKVCEAKNLILIYMDRIHVFVVDKKGFENEDDVSAVREKLIYAVGEKKYKYIKK